MNRLPIFAGVDRDGVLRFVGDVPRRSVCGCRCMVRRAPLVARRGAVKEWHFAHEASQERPDCFADAVNLPRQLAIEQLRRRPALALPMCKVVSTHAATFLVGQKAAIHDCRPPLLSLYHGYDRESDQTRGAGSMTKAWEEIAAPKSLQATATQVALGPVIPPQQRLLTYSPDEWEGFTHEWVHYCLKKQYEQVQRSSGAGDMGIDVVGFCDAKRLKGVWDNYQCKHYDHALTPVDVWTEFGKVIWYSFKDEYMVPRRYYFVSPRGAGTKLTRLLGNADKLREELTVNWDKYIKCEITSTQLVVLDAPLRAYVDAFDFTIFEAKTALQLVDDHRSSPVHTARFGGGLPVRPVAGKPPAAPAMTESRYLTQLLGAYGEHTSTTVADPSALSMPKLKDHFRRQREAFYEAESLRVFARDTVPPGTFKSLQDDIFDGVIDTHDASHVDGYVKVCAVTKAARDVQITANALISCTNPKDRDGICHQLVNEERLRWTNR